VLTIKNNLIFAATNLIIFY